MLMEDKANAGGQLKPEGTKKRAIKCSTGTSTGKVCRIKKTKFHLWN